MTSQLMMACAPTTTLEFLNTDETDKELVSFPVKINKLPSIAAFKDNVGSQPDGFFKHELTCETGFLVEVDHTFTIFFYIESAYNGNSDKDVLRIGVHFEVEPSMRSRVIVHRIQYQLNNGSRQTMTKGPVPRNWKGDKDSQFFYAPVSSAGAEKKNVHLDIEVVNKPAIEFVRLSNSDEDEVSQEPGNNPEPQSVIQPVKKSRTDGGTIINASPYYLSQDFSDATIQCGDGTVIPVHRFALICRCEYFATMFSNNEMEEAKSGVIKIPDFSADCVKELLRYIYTGKSSSITTELFMAADKYGMEELKGRCERQLIQGLNPENAVEIYELGLANGSDLMINRAKRVMYSNRDQIMKDGKFLKEFTSKHEDLALELMKMQR